MNKQDLLNVTDGEVLKALISAMPPYELRIMYYELGSLLRKHPEQRAAILRAQALLREEELNKENNAAYENLD